MKLGSAHSGIQPALSPKSRHLNKSELHAHYDRASETFVYTQDGEERQVQLKNPIARGVAVGLSCAATSLLPLTLVARQVATPLLGNTAGIVLASVFGATAGWWTYSAAERDNQAAIAEAAGQGFCEKYERFGEKSMNRDIDQSGFEKALVGQLDPKLVKLHYSEDISRLDGKIPTTTELQEEFTKLAERPDIPFKYIIDGCYSRAHLMCEEMSQDGLNNAKIFVSVKNENTPDQLLVAKNGLMEANWNWHVAPLVVAKETADSKPEPFVVDPSMFDHPVKPQEWIAAMWDKQDELLVDITRREQYCPGTDTPSFANSIGDSHRTLHDYSLKLEEIKNPSASIEPSSFWSRVSSGAHDLLTHATR
jgi:hypothetical protein